MAEQIACNLCGGIHFEPGPNGRLSDTGRPPRCSSCQSLERHRATRRLFERLPPAILCWRRVLQFAPDNSLSRTWFRSYEGSFFGGTNSLDLQSIERPSQTYDLISLSHVLEFVPNDRMAFLELLRVGSECCIYHINFASRLEDAATTDFIAPKPPFGRYHDYGKDLIKRFEIRERTMFATFAFVEDPVTGTIEKVGLFAKLRNDAETLNAALTAEDNGITIERWCP